MEKILVFRDDTLLVRDGAFEFAELPSGVLRSSLALSPVWREAALWCEVGTADTEKNAAPVFPNSTGEEGAEGECSEERFFEEWVDLCVVWHRWGDEAFVRAGTAYQYMNWLRRSRFCSGCGAPLAPKTEERALQCVECGRVSYAPLHPAIIVAVEKEGKLLLAHNTRMPERRYSVLAGFVEPGESLEQTIAREIMEEAGIEVRDIRYFGSQCWPFPCSLMLGFTARWSGGELRPDGAELDDAGWFAPDEFPDVPPGMSISRRLIDDFAARMRKRYRKSQPSARK
jgi:NAD+ diphosphatase